MLLILESVSVNETKWVIHQISVSPKNGEKVDIAEAKGDAGFVQDEDLVEAHTPEIRKSTICECCIFSANKLLSTNLQPRYQGHDGITITNSRRPYPP